MIITPKMIEEVHQHVVLKQLEIDKLRNAAYKNISFGPEYRALCRELDAFLRALEVIGFPGVLVAESLNETYFKFSKEHALALISQANDEPLMPVYKIVAERIEHADSEDYLIDGCGECHRMPDCACDILRAVAESKSVLREAKAKMKGGESCR